MSTQNQLTLARALELFTELKSRADAARWQKAVEGVSTLGLKVYGQLPNFEVVEGTSACKVKIFDGKRFSCACKDFTGRLQKKGAACRHVGAVALSLLLPLAVEGARARGASPLADELEALRQTISQAQARAEEDAERRAIQDESGPADETPAPPPPPETDHNGRAPDAEKKVNGGIKANGASNSHPSSETTTGTSTGNEPAPNDPPRMTLKRSVSPDGHIDSLSIQFDVPITKSSTAELQAQALRLMALQDGIWQRYRRQLQENERPTSGKNPPPAHGESAPVTDGNPEVGSDHPQKARLVGVGQADTQYGKRTFLSFELDGGRKAKLFGSEKALAKELTALGLKPNAMKPGARLNVPCLVFTVTKGNYLNVDRVFPPAK